MDHPNHLDSVAIEGAEDMMFLDDGSNRRTHDEAPSR